ncbi:MAG: V-type ATP synthase subunit I [Planctomycetota bacterium]
MLRCVPMSKVLLVGPKEGLGALTDLLHRLHRAHIVKLNRLPEGFGHGRPLPGGGKYSEQLVQLRAIKATLPTPPVFTGTPVKSSQMQVLIDGAIKDTETQLLRKMSERDDLQRKLETVNLTATALAPFQALGLNLDYFQPFDSIQAFVGKTVRDIEPEVTAAGLSYELFRGDLRSPQSIALFVTKADAPRVPELLSQVGFNEDRLPVPVAGLTDYQTSPAGGYTGAVDALLQQLGSKAATLQASRQVLDREIEKLRGTWATDCLSAEEHLEIQVEKSELPFDVLVTEHAYLVEFWVPDQEVAAVRSEMERTLGDIFHFEVLQYGGGHHKADAGEAVAHAEGHGHEEQAAHVGDGHHEVQESVPVQLSNPPFFNFFETMTKMFAVPAYDEVDPTFFLSLFFPLFFGLMVGDVGYGVLITAIGWLGLRGGKPRSELRALGMFMLSSGVVAVLTGYFVFGDGFGVPFYGHEGHAGWDTVFGLTNWPLLRHTIPIEKLESAGVSEFLVLSIVFGLIHMTIGFGIGAVNEARHSIKHGLAKIAWLGILWTVGLIVMDIGMCRDTKVGSGFWTVLAFCENSAGHLNMSLLGVLGLASLALLLITEPGAIVELIAPLSNTMSYTRLAGIGIAKAALAMAVNTMFFPLWDAGIGGKIVCVVALLLGHTVILGLGILSGAVQSLRLNFFEFFAKFYKGGGAEYMPFGRWRQYTLPD